MRPQALTLDEDQARVVAHGDGPAAVLAGAGAGKTRCTTERAVRRLREDGIAAEGMLLLTFTNKAAGEMRERLAARLPAGARLPFIGTFHAFGNRLLREYGRTIDVPANATLMDGEDGHRMLDTLLGGVLGDRERRRHAIAVHEACSAAGLDITDDGDLQQIHQRLADAGFGPVAAARCIQRLRRFEREKRQAGLLDYGDLILLAARLLRRDTAAREQLRARYRDITIDEAQDTDGAQFRLLRLLAPEGGTVILVGDDDQAIYEWRHARPENLRTFIEHYRATVYRLERNYRSTPAIVESGARLVAHNSERLEKRPRPVRSAPADDRLRLHLHPDIQALAESLAQLLRDRLKAGIPASDMAVLYRKKRMVRNLEPALLRLQVPYRVRAGMDLLAYADVRMMLAAGRLAMNPRDTRALSRLAELVPGLGARAVSRLLNAAPEAPLTAATQLRPQVAGAVERLRDALEALRSRGPEQLYNWCLGTPAFRNWLEQRARRGGGDSPDEILRPARSRMQAVQRAMSRRAGVAADDPRERWTQALAIIAGGDDNDGETDAVTLSTMHAAKGLEWPEVHIAGFSSGLMPLERDGRVDNPAEERRLAYVAITRARERLWLHHSDRIDLGGGPQPAEPSPYLAELGDDDDNVERTGHTPGQDQNDGEQRSGNDWLAEMRRRFA